MYKAKKKIHPISLGSTISLVAMRTNVCSLSPSLVKPCHFSIIAVDIFGGPSQPFFAIYM